MVFSFVFNVQSISQKILSGKATTEFTGYSYFPMPFWSKAHLFVENQEKHTIMFCHQLKVEANNQSQEDTGYFGGHQAYFIGNQRGESQLKLTLLNFRYSTSLGIITGIIDLVISS